MKTKKTGFAERFTVGVSAGVVASIRSSAQSAPDWLRQAAQERIEREGMTDAEGAPAEKLRKTLQAQHEELKQQGVALQREIGKLHRSDAETQASLAELRAGVQEISSGVTTIQNSQKQLMDLLAVLDRNFNRAIKSVAPSLLPVLDQRIDALMKAAEKNKSNDPFRDLPPPPERTAL